MSLKTPLLSISQLVNDACTQLNWSPTPRLDAELLLSYVLKIGRIYIATNPNKLVTINEAKLFNKLILRRQNKEPIAYIIKEKDFYGFSFKVTRDTLIPRPETELLIDLTLKIISEKSVKSIVDIGTGSGCIILSLAKILFEQDSKCAKMLKFHAIDISQDALKVAKTNYRNFFPKREVVITFYQGNLLSPIMKKVDLIISNPPYIPQNVYASLEENVRQYEPKLALVGGKSGIEVIKQLFAEAVKKLNPGGIIILEMHHNQAAIIIRLAKKTFTGAKIEIVKDYAGLNRIAIIQT